MGNRTKTKVREIVVRWGSDSDKVGSKGSRSRIGSGLKGICDILYS